MSDPVTNVEIEDVLSSIRRLVSDDTRIRPIAWGDTDTNADTETNEVERESDAATATASDVGRLVLTPALRVSDADAEGDASRDVWSNDVDLEVAEQPSDVTSVYVLDANRDAATDSDAHYAGGLPEAEAEAGDLHDLAQDAAAFYNEDVVFASTRDSGVRDGASDPVVDRLDAPDDRGFLLSEDETVLDEDTLRELVAEIVRQELQGALGERITRNVRKLVRREIQRALTSNELE
jgi:hypothetical protein